VHQELQNGMHMASNLVHISSISSFWFVTLIRNSSIKLLEFADISLKPFKRSDPECVHHVDICDSYIPADKKPS
jgi:hypothetical protein